jgi:hypothetical protein
MMPMPFLVPQSLVSIEYQFRLIVAHAPSFAEMLALVFLRLSLRDCFAVAQDASLGTPDT